jgi:aspartyl-tRNA(Asn)/glutamyl-tRNA(Gln) amidotransferase subunit B
MSEKGWLQISDPKGEFEPKKVGIIRAHLEEDAGKSQHDEVAGKADSRIDLNRTGTPLLEIVSEPDMRSPREAKAYLTELKLLLEYLDVSDCNMQEGSLRVDANVNLHVHSRDGKKVATPIVEIKNMNSFRAVERAIAYEAERQYEVFKETGQTIGKVAKQTRGWDDQEMITRGQRHKEESSDYRYFPDPDLCPVITPKAEVDAVRASLGELPAQTRQRLETTYGLTPYDSDVIVSQGSPTVAYFLALADATGDGKKASNWVQQEVLRTLNERGGKIEDFPVTAAMLSELVKAVGAGDIDLSRAKEVFNDMVATGKTAAEVMKERGIEKVDTSALRDLCAELLAANPRIVADVKSGKEQAVGQLVGQAKKKNANVNPAEVRAICLDLIKAM